MFVAVVMLFINGTPVDVDVLGVADSMSACVDDAKGVLPVAMANLDGKTQIVIKCFQKDHLPQSVADFQAQPIAASGFGTKK